ncbi:phosphotransferase [Paenibacillus rhizovicinus]|uniref:Phosphotransferase n=1 Tax=Paenibacillus rhizovicinus TaxID=2704463 RepID=A0A6C0NYI5_9BACL|nr:phosphotransferase [Paenibacillus rhizovicinus]QHW31287.1 phosphotransferase [Paenibacillus rhizovicinus]
MRDRIEAVIRCYFDHPAVDMDDVPFGLTNVTRIVTVGGQRYVVRLYNRHTKSAARMALEIDMTSYLDQSSLSVGVPVFLRTREGGYYAELPDGTLGAMTTFLEGTVPAIADADQAEAYGRVVGEMVRMLGSFSVDERRHTGVSFLDWAALHPLANHDTAERFLNDPPFAIAPDAVAFYRNAVTGLVNKKEQLLRLPRQFVHHDILIFNLLAVDNRISGVLDFDLASLDVRMMEFSISLNHVLQLSGGSMAMAEAFVKGYAAFHSLTELELDQLQALTQAYHVAVLHFYIGQHHAGQDVEQPFGYILEQFMTRDAWLDLHGTELRKLLSSCVVQ